MKAEAEEQASLKAEEEAHIAEELRLKAKAKEQAEEEARFSEELRPKAEKEEQELLKVEEGVRLAL